MINGSRDDYTTRNNILKLLSDDEVARVSTAETAPSLLQGEEYIDLEHVDLGVKRAGEAHEPPMGRVLPRNAVHDDTWSKIVELLAASDAAHGSPATAAQPRKLN